MHTTSGLTQVGLGYTIKILAYNDISFVSSDSLVVILAAIPDTPTVIPYQDYTQTTGNQIKVLYTPFIAG